MMEGGWGVAWVMVGEEGGLWCGWWVGSVLLSFEISRV